VPPPARLYIVPLELLGELGVATDEAYVVFAGLELGVDLSGVVVIDVECTAYISDVDPASAVDDRL
jgi:hypothetical protein